MTSITSVSQTELAQRRQKLRHQRRLKALQNSWRTLAVSGLAGSLAWVITLPGWVIRQPTQIAIAGNRFLSEQAIQSYLPLSYPQSLFQLEPQTLAENLESQAPIAEATVARQLFPPRLIVQVTERYPVAVTSLNLTNVSAALSEAKTSAHRSSSVGLLDASGVWMPLESYVSLNQSFKLPPLQLIGSQEQYRPYWSQIYQQISRSPVKVSEIDWRDPNNLILKTELGIVHLGPYSSKFASQLEAVDRMRKLPEKLNSKQIEYIDLKNPEAPAIQMNRSSNPAKPNLPE